MATNRDIVATRKLNKKNKARLGRGGDTKIREVDGRDSHVNALEAYLIDVDKKAGEEYTKRVGSGTTNPLTGMPEYYDPDKVSYEDWQGMDPHERNKMLADWGIGDENLKFIDPVTGEARKELAFAEREQTLAESTAGATKEFTEKGLGLTMGAATRAQEAATRQAGVATAGITAGAAGTREALGRQLSAGSRGIGRGMAQARAGAESAAAKSGFARSGTVTGAMGQQMKALTQDYGQMQADYAGGLGAATRQANIGLAGVRAGEQTAAGVYKGAQESYGLGMEAAASTYDSAKTGSDLAFDKAKYGIEKTAMDEFYSQLAEVGGESRTLYQTDPEGNALTKYYQGKSYTREALGDNKFTDWEEV